MSGIEEEVIAKIRERAEVGSQKYVTTMEREDLTFQEWLKHLQEEMMDGCVYLQKIINLLEKYEKTPSAWVEFRELLERKVEKGWPLL